MLRSTGWCCNCGCLSICSGGGSGSGSKSWFGCSCIEGGGGCDNNGGNGKDASECGDELLLILACAQQQHLIVP